MLALVTGGAGFIGSTLVDALVARGDEAVVVDDLSTGTRENLEGAIGRGARLVEADVRDAEGMAALVDEVRPDAIFHLAAQMDVRLSVRSPLDDLLTNAGGTVNLLEAARQADVARFVNASTGGAMYGQVESRPTPEDHPVAPDAPYGVSKRAAEEYCALFGRLHGLSTVSLRLGNVYGPRQHPLSEAGVVAIFCGCALRGEAPTIFGDGLQTRDFVHVDDVVAAILAAARSDLTGPVNIATGIETSVLDLVAAIAPHVEAGFEPVHQPERPGEIRNNALDSSRAREELGWEPQVTVEDGLPATLAWMREQAGA
jgi:UDP-glucose 4-epimerase